MDTIEAIVLYIIIPFRFLYSSNLFREVQHISVAFSNRFGTLPRCSLKMEAKTKYKISLVNAFSLRLNVAFHVNKGKVSREAI